MTRPNLAIDPARLWASLHDTAAIGGTPAGGIHRLTLTEPDREVRAWFARACEDAGLNVSVDEAGNQFARREGTRPELPPIAVGSHLDTQPTGGRFDGVLGVLAGLEVMRTLEDAGVETESPLLLVNWTNEEGSRFAPAMLGSAVHAGIVTPAEADATRDRAGVSFGEALDGIGARGPVPAGATPIGAYLELHIEQGPVLEASGVPVGVVTGVQGMTWHEITVTGTEAHAGATPMAHRRDALRGAARLVEAVHALAMAEPPGVGTVGLLEVRPASRNVIPGEAFLTTDLRHPDGAAQVRMAAALRAAAEAVAAELDLAVRVEEVWHAPPIPFDEGLRGLIRESAARRGLVCRDIVSGAGHDAANLARVVPAAMIFVPCAGGLSHNEAESATREDCAAGAQVLLDAVLALDAGERG